MADKRSFSVSSFSIEKIIIGLIFIIIFAAYLITGEREIRTGNAYTTVLALQLLLALYYAITVRNLYSLLLLGLAVSTIRPLLISLSYPVSDSLLLAGLAGYAAAGLALGYRTIRESMSNKDFELFGALVAFGFFYPLIHYLFLSGYKEFILVYYFAFAFILGTVMYNDNLWDKYNAAEKKILLYALVGTLLEVFIISIKLL